MRSIISLLTSLILNLNFQIALAIPVDPIMGLTSRQNNAAFTPDGDTEFHNEMLNAHNFFRAKHNASALIYNEYLRDDAQGSTIGCDFTRSVRADFSKYERFMKLIFLKLIDLRLR